MLAGAFGKREMIFTNMNHAIECIKQSSRMQKRTALELRCTEHATKVYEEQGSLRRLILYLKFLCYGILFLQKFVWVLPRKQRNTLNRGICYSMADQKLNAAE